MVEAMVSPGGLAMGMAGVDLRVEQALPLWGIPRVGREMAEAGADADTAGLAMMRRDMARMAGMAWVDWWWMQTSVARMTEELAAMERMREATLRRYAAGTATSLDTLAVDAESAAMEAELRAMESERDAVRARIGGLLGQPGVALPPPPAALPDLALPADAPSPESDQGAAMVAMARSEAEMARKERLPMLGWMASWEGMEAPSDQFMAGLSVSVPITGRARAGAIRAADARVAAAEAQAEAMTVERDRAIAEVRARLEGRRAALASIEARLIPTAKARVEAARTAYAAGTAPVGALLDAEQAWVRAQSTEVEARARLAIEANDLALLLGGAP